MNRSVSSTFSNPTTKPKRLKGHANRSQRGISNSTMANNIRLKVLRLGCNLRQVRVHIITWQGHAFKRQALNWVSRGSAKVNLRRVYERKNLSSEIGDEEARASCRKSDS